MKGPKPKYKIQLVENEITELRKLVSAHNSPQVKVMRARIVLDAHEHPEWSNQQIAAMLGVLTGQCGNGDKEAIGYPQRRSVHGSSRVSCTSSTRSSSSSLAEGKQLSALWLDFHPLC